MPCLSPANAESQALKLGCREVANFRQQYVRFETDALLMMKAINKLHHWSSSAYFGGTITIANILLLKDRFTTGTFKNTPRNANMLTHDISTHKVNGLWSFLILRLNVPVMLSIIHSDYSLMYPP
uniref:Uncharacterized protein n=1 Tax=Nelumbo nucifera TaxID=4432 RepID=A0A822ZF73_NELNU|nr:TPA_asm: hypothetical protein HUJ06_003074 [Nelumbo nucifera]